MADCPGGSTWRGATANGAVTFAASDLCEAPLVYDPWGGFILTSVKVLLEVFGDTVASVIELKVDANAQYWRVLFNDLCELHLYLVAQDTCSLKNMVRLGRIRGQMSLTHFFLSLTNYNAFMM